MTAKEPRFAIEKLERKLKDPDHTDLEFAATIGVSRDKLRNWRRHGIKLYSADRLAIRLGYHPSYFWPEYWNTEQTNQPYASMGQQEDK